MASIKTFVKASAIEFEVKANPYDSFIVDTKLGDTFLREGAVCMRVEASAHQAVKGFVPSVLDEVKEKLLAAYWIINLQTGRVFVAKTDDPIQFIRIKMTVEGE